MKQILLLMLVFMFSCNRNDNDKLFIKNNEFISEPGVYYHKRTKIIVKEFKDGSLIYGLADKRNNIIYQQNINQSFSNNGSWMIFIDEKDNIWFYTSDLQLTTVLIKEKAEDTYTYKKITDSSFAMPDKMKSEIQKKTN
jgi:hypothetical protein